MDQKRMILAIALSMAVLYFYTRFFAPAPLSPKPAQTVKEEPGHPIQKPESSIPGMGESLESSARKIPLENDLVSAQLISKGAVLNRWILKNYHHGTSQESPLIDLLDEQGRAFVLTMGESLADTQPEYELAEEKTLDGKKALTMKWANERLTVVKRFILGAFNEPHSLDIEVEIENKGDADLTLEPKLAIIRQQKVVELRRGFFSFLKGPVDVFFPLTFVNGSLKKHENWEKLSPRLEERGKISWTGLSDRYFLMSLIARQESDQILVASGRQDNAVYTSLSYGPVSLKPGENLTQRYSAYLGPKTRENLKALGANLEKSVDYGWFSFLATPLLWLLIFFEKIIHNWGIAIILLTFLVKLLLHPVNKKSIQSMKAMQKLQPRLAEIREKYKNDRERLNMEMMNLFRTHKVNPMGGCLPLIVQMPVYIALYKVLWNAVELYHAPFFWIYKDLAAPDPFLITPILLGIFMALQQKLNPQATSMDPAQAKVMMIMPLMFSAFMIFLPFGLVLYILVNTVMSVVQQYMVQHELSFADLIKKLKRA